MEVALDSFRHACSASNQTEAAFGYMLYTNVANVLLFLILWVS